MFIFLIFIISSYLIGAIPFSLIFSKIFSNIDVRYHGSRNVGATNVLVVTGKKKAAILAVIFDLIKGFAVVIFSKIFFGSDILAYTSGFFAVLGHDFSIYLGFKGGKGVATSVGSIIAINPFSIGFLVFAYVISILVTRYIILSTLISFIVLPFILWILGEGFLGIIFGILYLALAFYVHRGDIERLVSGKEKKLSDVVI